VDRGHTSGRRLVAPIQRHRRLRLQESQYRHGDVVIVLRGSGRCPAKGSIEVRNYFLTRPAANTFKTPSSSIR